MNIQEKRLHFFFKYTRKKATLFLKYTRKKATLYLKYTRAKDTLFYHEPTIYNHPIGTLPAEMFGGSACFRVPRATRGFLVLSMGEKFAVKVCN